MIKNSQAKFKNSNNLMIHHKWIMKTLSRPLWLRTRPLWNKKVFTNFQQEKMSTERSACVVHTPLSPCHWGRVTNVLVDKKNCKIDEDNVTAVSSLVVLGIPRLAPVQNQVRAQLAFGSFKLSQTDLLPSSTCLGLVGLSRYLPPVHQ
jgi:hypothetical protein